MYQGRPTQTLMALPDGPLGTRETLKIMRDLVRGPHGKLSPTIRDKAVNLTFYVARSDWAGRARAIWDFVKSNIRYIPDVRGWETVYWPTQTMSQGFGDCDDHSALVASLAESIGIPTRFVAVGFHPGQFQHVFTEALLGTSWVPLETTEDEPMGWRPPNIATAYIMRN